MKTDDETRHDVEEELRFAPDVDPSDIAVHAKDGIVTLAGFVPGFVMKFRAEAAAKRVAGVLGVANDLEVRVPSLDQRPDPEIARDAVHDLRTKLPFSSHNIQVVVSDGWIRLEGEAEWHYQRERAEEAVRMIKGVKGVINALDVRPRATPIDIKKKIEDAFRRSAEVDANNILVETHDGEVVLKGTVRSWFEREEAERAAWAAPGVKRVIDQIAIKP